MHENIKKFIRDEDALKLLRKNRYIIRIEDENSFSIQDSATGNFDEYSINSLYFMIYEMTHAFIRDAIISHLWDENPDAEEYLAVEIADDIIAKKEYEEFIEIISELL